MNLWSLSAIDYLFCAAFLPSCGMMTFERLISWVSRHLLRAWFCIPLFRTSVSMFDDWGAGMSLPDILELLLYAHVRFYGFESMT